MKITPLLDINQTAEILGISTSMLEKLRANRKIAFIKAGRRTVRFSEAQIEDYLSRSTVTPRKQKDSLYQQEAS